MAKYLLGLVSFLALFFPLPVLAEEQKINLTPPASGIFPQTPIGVIITNALTIIFIVAGLIVLFMLVIGAIQWILSGGDKEAIGHARGRITHALIGLVILALAFLIAVVVGKVVDINLLGPKTIPSLGQGPCPGGFFPQSPDQPIEPTKNPCPATPKPTQS